jgi:hypothetical protein
MRERTRAREGTGTKAPRRGGARVRLSLRLDAATVQKLQLHALMTRRHPGEILGELLNAHLPQYVLQTRGKATETLPPPGTG